MAAQALGLRIHRIRRSLWADDLRSLAQRRDGSVEERRSARLIARAQWTSRGTPALTDLFAKRFFAQSFDRDDFVLAALAARDAD